MTAPTILSLGEIDSLCLKAARGAGFSWGLAQEAGRAARALAAWRLPGVEALAAHLAEIDGDVARYAPSRNGEAWSCAAGAHCPISLGAALSDFSDVLTEGPTEIGSVRHPILLLPFLRMIAEYRTARVVLVSVTGRVEMPPSGPLGPPGPATVWRDAQVFLAPADGPLGLVMTKAPYSVDAATLASLSALAHRTYVPATEESRQSGAGAGETDND